MAVAVLLTSPAQARDADLTALAECSMDLTSAGRQISRLSQVSSRENPTHETLIYSVTGMNMMVFGHSPYGFELDTFDPEYSSILYRMRTLVSIGYPQIVATALGRNGLTQCAVDGGSGTYRSCTVRYATDALPGLRITGYADGSGVEIACTYEVLLDDDY